MPVAELIELAIGIVFVYLTVSLACSQIQEMIARRLDMRAKQLEKSIAEMISNPATYAALYHHPLIAALGKNGQNPEYIPPRIFSQALFDSVITASPDPVIVRHALTAVQARLQALPNAAAPVLNQFNTLIARAQALEQSLDAAQLQTLMNEVSSLAGVYPELKQIITLDQLKRSVSDINNAELRRTLITLIGEAETNLRAGENALLAVRNNFEHWFDDTMDRASVFYKIHVQRIIFGIALGIALILNVDTISVANALWREPSLRQAVAAQAEALNRQNAAATTALDIRQIKTKLEDLRLPVGWTFMPAPQGRRCAFNPTEANSVWGWERDGTCFVLENGPWDPPGVLIKVVGLLATALAAMQGAPFWFDMLQKLVSVGETTRAEQAQQEKLTPGG